MAEAIVIELQRLASDSSHNLGDLVRKALLVATKLSRDDFATWLQQELHGYKGDVPEYRIVRAEIQVRNPYHGYQPFIIGDTNIEDKLANVSIDQPITEIQALLESDSDTYFSPFTGEVVAFLMKLQNSIAPLPPTRSISRSAFLGILEVVRTAILEWALRLEREGILGDGLSFSAAERSKAASLPQVNINNFQGILGDVSSSTVSLSFAMSVRAADFNSLADQLRQASVSEEDIQDLKTAIAADPQPVDKALGSRVSAWVGRMISKAAEGTWQIGLNGAGNFLATALWAYYHRGG